MSNVDKQPNQDDATLSVDEAARLYQVSERTIRNRIRAGQLIAFKQPTLRGYEWRIKVDNTPSKVDGEDRNDVSIVENQDGNEPSNVTANDDKAIALRALDLVEKLQRENTQLAGQVGFLQAELRQAQEQIQLLTAPAEPEPEQARLSWWQRLLKRPMLKSDGEP